MASEAPRNFTLLTSDGKAFEVEEAVAFMCTTIRSIIDDGCVDEEGIPLPNVTGKTMEKVLEYCKRHAQCGQPTAARQGFLEEPFMDEELRYWEKSWAGRLGDNQEALFDVIMAANYLNIKGLLDLTCKTVADMIKQCKTPEQVREKFHIKNDYTPEEEEEVRRENAWAFTPEVEEEEEEEEEEVGRENAWAFWAFD